MKSGIHPEYKTVTVSCACGNTFETGTTVESIHVEICSACHPFYTGKQKMLDTAGRVERYNKKYGLEEPASLFYRLLSSPTIFIHALYRILM